MKIAETVVGDTHFFHEEYDHEFNPNVDTWLIASTRRHLPPFSNIVICDLNITQGWVLQQQMRELIFALAKAAEIEVMF